MIFDMGRTFGVPKWIMYEINAWYDFGMVYATPESGSLGDNPDLTNYLASNNCFVIASPSNESGERATWDEYGVRLVEVDYPYLIFTINDANMDGYEFNQSALNGLRGFALIIPFTLGDDADSAGNSYWERTNIINVSDIPEGILPVTKGGTGATTAAEALVNFGITATAGEINDIGNMKFNLVALDDKISGGELFSNNPHGWQSKTLTSANFDSKKTASIIIEHDRFLLYGQGFAEDAGYEYRENHVALIDFNTDDLVLYWGYGSDGVSELKMLTEHDISGGYYAPLCTGAEAYKGNKLARELKIRVNGSGKTAGTLYYMQI